jgi:hypothetical protein
MLLADDFRHWHEPDQPGRLDGKSVDRTRPEVTGTRRNRRDLTQNGARATSCTACSSAEIRAFDGLAHTCRSRSQRFTD